MPTPFEAFPFDQPPVTPDPPALDSPNPKESIDPLPPPPEFPPLEPGVPTPSDGWLDDPHDLSDPPVYGEELSDARAALFVSDLHLSDGGVGDDFLEGHLVQRGNLFVGNRAATRSRGILLSQVVQYAITRAASVGIPRIDFVLNGDTFDLLELLARGTPWSKKHLVLFQLCDWLRSQGHGVYYVVGNHDWIIPPGPWVPSACYANTTMKVFAEHGDRYDKFNWPRGISSIGAKLVLGTNIFGYSIGRLEPRVDQLGPGLAYLMAGLDNLRPFSDEEIGKFIEAHYVPGMFPNIASAAAAKSFFVGLLAAMGFAGQPDDSSGYIGAQWMRSAGPYKDWLMVQGHTHVPVAIPRVYYNTGTFTPTLVVPGNETLIEAFPFLLTMDVNGQRREEFRTAQAINNTSVLRNRAAVNRLREHVFKYAPR